MVTGSQVGERAVAVEHGWAGPGPETWRTAANGVTAARTVLAVLLGVVALVEGSVPLLVAGYAAYWVGDVADGAVARHRDEETRIGAAADILCDRVCTVVLGAGLLVAAPDVRLAVAVFVGQFVLVDLPLSLGCLRWPVLSPNYFARIDPWLYRWNWSPPAKAVNSSAVVLVAVLTGSLVAGVVLAVAGLVVKVVSLRRMVLLERGAA